MALSTKKYSDDITFYDFDDEIKRSISVGNNLDFTKTLIATKFDIKLGSYDVLRIEESYVNFLKSFWLEEVTEQIAKSIHPSFIVEFIKKLKSVNNFADINELLHFINFNNEQTVPPLLFTYSLQLKELTESSCKLLIDEKHYIGIFKHNCCVEALSNCGYKQNEKNFFEHLINLLKFSKSPIDLCKYIRLLPNVYNFENVLHFKEFLNSLLKSDLSNEYVLQAQQAATKLIEQNVFHFTKDAKEIIISYLQPVTVAETKDKERVILQVLGKHMVISNVLNEVEGKLKESDKIEEVHFADADVIHIDTNLNAAIWHGKNVVVSAKTVIVSEDKKITWDVSGKDAVKAAHIAQAGTGDDGCGLPGADGKHGESGGNVYIKIGDLKNGHNFTVKSNGGNGSNGQDGGKGENGKEGNYLDQKTFKAIFPPVSTYSNSDKRSRLQITMQSVLHRFECLDEFYVGSSYLGQMSKHDFQTFLLRKMNDMDNFYFKVRTDNGCKITFSFYYGGWFERCQSFLLHEGSLGTEGKSGGEGGQQGIGGYAGEINIQASDSNVTVYRDNGKEGLPGKMGTSGNPGKSGPDRAYMDKTLSTYWPKFPGNYEDKKLKATYQNIESSDRIFCSHNNLYADIVEKEIEYKKINSYRITTDMKQTMKHIVYFKNHVQRKKTISEETITNLYPQKLYSLNFLNESNLIDEIKTVLESNPVDETVETENITTDIKVIQLVNYFQHNVDNCIDIHDSIFIEAPKNDLDRLSPAQLIELVTGDPSNINNWTKLLQIRLDIYQLEDLWNTVLTNIHIKELMTEEFNEQLKIGFCNKYQLAVMEHIASKILGSHYSDPYKTDSISFAKQSDISVNSFYEFFSVNDKENIIGADIQPFFLRDTVEERNFMFEELDKLWKYPVDNMQIINNILKQFINEPSLHSGDLLKALEDVKVFKEEKERVLSNRFEAFKNALWIEKDRSVYNELYKSIVEKNNDSLVTFENKINCDKFLFLLYNAYVKEAQRQYSWEYLFKCDNFKKVETIVYHLCLNFTENGPFSACYRELLAYHFEINILIYSMSERKKFILTHNHNPKARSSLHFLLCKNKFLHLNVNSEFVEMYRSHISQSRLLNDMFIQIDSFIEKEQFDNFISKCLSTTDVCKGVNIDKSLKIRFRIINILMQENNIKKILQAFHLDSQENIEMLSYSLEKLKHEYTGCEAVLHGLALHFESEGRHISAKELMYVINFVLRCALNMPHLVEMVSWTLAANSQTQWLVEIILLKVELCLKRILSISTKAKWREYLTKQNESNILMLLMEKMCEETFNATEKQFEDIIYLLSNIRQGHIGLDQLNFTEWKYYLKNKFWANKLNELAKWSSEDLNHAAYYLVVLENVVGYELCKKLVEVLKGHKTELVSESIRALVPNIFSVMTNREVNLDESLLKYLKNNNVSDWIKQIEKECFSTGKDRTLDELQKLVKNNGNTSEGIKGKLDDIVKTVKRLNIIVETLKKLIKDESNLKEWIKMLLEDINGVETSFIDKIKKYIKSHSITDKTFRDVGTLLVLNSYHNPLNDIINKAAYKLKSLGPIEPKDILETVFATVVVAVEMKNKIQLRDTQKLAIMTMLKSKDKILSQISTGEGKSFIIVVFSIVKILTEEQDSSEKKWEVDIITSSRVLAMRDADTYKDIYNLFGISVSHNCSEDAEERKKVYSYNKVVYGDLANFQRDYLLDKVYNKSMIGNRSFKTVIVDEVDSMLLDKGNNILYLSHEIPGLDKLESVFIFIWKSLHIPTESGVQLEVILSVLKDRILNDIFELVTKESLKCLDATLNNEEVNTTWDFLVGNGFIDSCGKVLKPYIENQFETLPENCIHKNHLEYIFKKVSERESSLIVPNYLKHYIEDHLEEWIKNGVRAMTMEPGVDYVVDIDRSETSGDHSPNITIVDQDTGMDLTNSQWENGLHQFLQLKHGCRISLISLKAVFISNVTYLKMYKHLYGLSGTLGSNVERELLKETYEVDIVTIPTAKTKCFTEEMPIVCSSRDDWMNTICKEVNKIRKTRSVLIVCETVDDVMILRKQFVKDFSTKGKDTIKHIHTYTRDYEKLTIAKDLEPGHIIISTNLAGRGTDITLSKKLVDNGGLHVCLTYLPRNSRIEEQAFGRAARNGQRGSGQIIFQNSTKKTALTVILLKQQRDVDEVLRIANIKDYYKSHIQQEEYCFDKFLEEYKSIKENSPHPENIKLLLCRVSLDLWAFWLEKNSSTLNIESVKTFVEEIKALTNENCQEWSKVIKDPFQLVKLGLALIEIKQYDDANSLFNRVIAEEPLFSEGAQYYRLYGKCRPKRINVSKEEIFKDMTVVAKKLEERIQTSSLAAYTIDFLKKRDSSSLLQIESFKEQQLNITKTYGLFLQSIHNIIGNGISYDDFILITYLDEESASIVFNDLIRERVILKPKVKNCCTLKDFSFAVNYGILPEDLYNILKKCEGKIFVENEILRHLNKTCLLPSRELFWSVLLSKKILTNEKTYCIIDMKRLQHVDPSSVNILKQLKDTTILDENEIWLYQPNEVGYTDNHYAFVENVLVIQLIGPLKYSFFINKSIICLNKVATLCKTRGDVKFDQFDCLKKKDFLKLGISLDTALNIICELEKKCIIKRREGTEEFMLLADNKDLDDVVLSQFEAYTSDVVQLLKCCFSFRIALKEICLPKDNQNKRSDKMWSSLGIRLEENLIKDLHEQEIVSKHFIDPTVNLHKKLNEICSNLMCKEKFTNLFKDLYDTTVIKAIIGHLVLSDVIRQHNNTSYSINQCKVKGISLPLYLKSQTDTIKLILERQTNLQKTEVRTHIENVINNHTNSLCNVENPTFTLTPLLKELEKHHLPSSEVGIFYLNGLDNILSLSEKRYTLKMMAWSFCVFVAGMAQIAIGAMQTLLLSPVASAIFVSEGINDICYAVNAFYTGIFNWRNYVKSKVVSLIISACLFLKPIEMFKSLFGRKVTPPSSSISSLTNKCSAFQKAKDCFKSIFKKTTSSTVVDTSEVIVRNVAKQVVTQTIAGCTVGLAFVAVDNYIEPQLKSLGDDLVERTLGDIDEIDKHIMVDYVKEIYLLLGEKDAKQIVNMCFTKFLCEFKIKNKDNWALLLGKLTSVINKENISSWQKLRNKDSLSLEDYGALGLKLVDIITKLNDVKNISSNLVDHTIIPRMMSSLEQSLKKKLGELKNTPTRPPTTTNSEAEALTSQTIRDWKCEIKMTLSENISLCIVSPLLSTLKMMCGERIMRIGSESCPFYNKKETDELINHNELLYKKIEFKHGKDSEKSTSFYSKEYNECLVEIFKSKRSVPVYLEILKNNSSVDEYFLEFCCSVIPMALKVPMLRLVIERNGNQHIYGGNAGDSLAITVSPDESFVTNIRKNKILLKNVLESTYKSILECYPQYKGLTADLLHKMVISAVENDFYIKKYIEREATIVTEDEHGNNDINNVYFHDAEKEIQNIALVDENYISQRSVNDAAISTQFLPTDTRRKKAMTLSNSQAVKIQLIKGFEAALIKINHHILLAQPNLKSFKLTLEDFNETKHVIISNDETGRYFDSCTTEYELVVPLTDCNDEFILVDYNVTMRVNGECKNVRIRECNKHENFHGPHIEYTILPVDMNQIENLVKCTKGYIPLPIDCLDSVYGINKCHSAGELILPNIPLKNETKKLNKQRKKKKRKNAKKKLQKEFL